MYALTKVTMVVPSLFVFANFLKNNHATVKSIEQSKHGIIMVHVNMSFSSLYERYKHYLHKHDSLHLLTENHVNTTVLFMSSWVVHGVLVTPSAVVNHCSFRRARELETGEACPVKLAEAPVRCTDTVSTVQNVGL